MFYESCTFQSTQVAETKSQCCLTILENLPVKSWYGHAWMDTWTGKALTNNPCQRPHNCSYNNSSTMITVHERSQHAWGCSIPVSYVKNTCFSLAFSPHLSLFREGILHHAVLHFMRASLLASTQHQQLHICKRFFSKTSRIVWEAAKNLILYIARCNGDGKVKAEYEYRANECPSPLFSLSLSDDVLMIENTKCRDSLFVQDGDVVRIYFIGKILAVWAVKEHQFTSLVLHITRRGLPTHKI